jgi:hypothetical protein
LLIAIMIMTAVWKQMVGLLLLGDLLGPGTGFTGFHHHGAGFNQRRALSSQPRPWGFALPALRAVNEETAAEAPPAAPASASPEAAAEPARPLERTLDDDLPQLELENSLLAGVTKESSAKSEQSSRLEAVNERLQKTMALKERVESLFEAELRFISEQLEAEAAAEEVRAVDIEGLMEKFEGALAQKRELVAKDEGLLSQMENTLGMVREASIQTTMQRAIDGKSSLCAIERDLIGKMSSCLEQLGGELAESQKRAAEMRDTKSSLPDPSDGAAIRAYSWDEVASLKELLVASAESARQREATIESIKGTFGEAVERRREVLSGEDAAEQEESAEVADSFSAKSSSSSSSSSSSTEKKRNKSKKAPSSAALATASNDELVAEAVAGLKDALSGLARLTTAASKTMGPALKKAAVGVSAVVGNGADAFRAATEKWEQLEAASGGGAEDMKASFAEIKQAPEVRQALAKSSAAAVDVAEALGEISLKDDDDDDDDINGGSAGRGDSGIEETFAGIRRSSKALTALAGNIADSGQKAALPPSS